MIFCATYVVLIMIADMASITQIQGCVIQNKSHMAQEENISEKERIRGTPDAPPRRKIHFSQVEKSGYSLSCSGFDGYNGLFVSPYNEADILDESLFIVPGDEYPDTDYQPPSSCISGRITWVGILY